MSKAAQASLASFFDKGKEGKLTEGSPIVKRGSGAIYDDFKDGKCDIWSWNVNGINATTEKGIIQKFFKDNNPTVLCLNETKLQSKNLDEKQMYNKIPNGYDQYWNCCTSKPGYSGTAIFTKVKPLWVQFDFGKKHNDEGRSITLEFERFVLVAVYVPNAGEGLKRLNYRIESWDADFHDYLKKLENDKNKPVILAGDLNVAHHEIDIYDPKGKEKVPGYTPEERYSFTQLLDRGFTDTYRYLYPEKV